MMSERKLNLEEIDRLADQYLKHRGDAASFAAERMANEVVEAAAEAIRRLGGILSHIELRESERRALADVADDLQFAIQKARSLDLESLQGKS